MVYNKFLCWSDTIASRPLRSSSVIAILHTGMALFLVPSVVFGLLSPDPLLPPGEITSMGLPFTAFGTDGLINTSAIALQHRYALQLGNKVLLITGTTGEWPLLTVEERMSIAEAWVAAKKSAADKPKLFLNVGHQSVYDARRLAAHAATLSGIDAILMTPPGLPYHAPTLDDLVKSVKFALEPAPAMPAFYYHYPDVYGDTVSAAAFLRAAAREIPTLVGIKMAGTIAPTDLVAAAAVNATRFAVITTADKLPTCVAISPAPRGVLAYTYEAPSIRGLLAARGDAKAFSIGYEQLNRWRTLVASFNSGGSMSNYEVTGAKAVARLAGLPVGDQRLPLPTVSTATREQLAAVLRHAGMMPQPLA